MNHTSRRDFLKHAGIGATTMALAPQMLAAGKGKPLDAARGKRPNVLFIAIDDLNDWIGCLGGHPDTLTPNLDRLAARGVLFTNAHCAAPLCNASRAALMTGIRPSTSGVYYNRQPWRNSPVLKKAVTLPQHFRAGGYRAIGAGKIYHGRFPDPASWNDYWPDQRKNRPPDPSPGKKSLSGLNRGHFDWGPLNVKDDQMGDRKVADWTCRQLAKRHDDPLFLACGLFRPHLPWYVPGKYFDKFPLDKITLPDVKKDDLSDVPEIGRRIARPNGDHKSVTTHNQWRQAVQGYLASIHFADACLGRVLDALDQGPNATDTVIVLWADHGWHLGEKLHWRKFTLWEEATRNPLMFVVPGVTKPGGRCDQAVSLMDVYPTLVDVCGLTPNKKLEGKSLKPLLKDPSAERAEPALTTYGRNNHSVRSERWRYIRYRDGSEELYDHGSDKMEWTNLAAQSKYDAVKQDLARWLPKLNAPDSPTGKKKP